jgi:ribosomal protein S18 acetylase RimI-like enzyme
VSARFTIRRASKGDAAALGRLGGHLLRTHYEFDRRRFIAPGDDLESGYAWFLASQLAEDDVAVFVAEQDDSVVGYIYVGIEPHSWKELREECGFIHDIVVSAEGRRGGVATALIDTAIAWLKERGSPRVMLWTAEPNEAAQKLFAKLGFRRTMIEMTRELDQQ